MLDTKDHGQLQQRSGLSLSALGAGGNRTLVREVRDERATTIPDLRLTAAERSGPHHRRVFPRGQRSFPPPAVSPCCPPPLLLPGCGGPAPRVLTDRWDSLPTDEVRRRERSRHRRFFWVPRFRSLSNSGRTSAPSGLHVETDQPRGVPSFCCQVAPGCRSTREPPSVRSRERAPD